MVLEGVIMVKPAGGEKGGKTGHDVLKMLAQITTAYLARFMFVSNFNAEG